MTETETNIHHLYTSIGRFAVEFEQICHTMESGVRCILAKEGLENERIQEVILAGLTAEPLNSLFHSLCYEHLRPDSETARIIDYVFNSFQKLISARNDLLHGKWFLVGKEQDGNLQPVALGQKLHKKKTGSFTKRFENDINDFQSLCDKAYFSLSSMAKVSTCIAGNYPIAKNFRIIDKGKYAPVSGCCIK